MPDIDPETSAMHTRRERPTGLLAPVDTASAARASAATQRGDVRARLRGRANDLRVLQWRCYLRMLGLSSLHLLQEPLAHGLPLHVENTRQS